MGDVGRARRPARRSPAEWGPDGERFLADVVRRLAALGPTTLERQALRIRSYEMRHLFAGRATRGKLSYDVLVGHLRRAALGSRDLADGLPRLVPKWTYALARVIGLQHLEPDDALMSARLLGALWEQSGADAIAPEHQNFAAQQLFAAGAHDTLRRALKDFRALTPAQRLALTADLRNPAISRTGDDAAWHATVREIFAAARLEPVRLVGDATTRFDRLTSDVPAGTVSGPLVSVLLTCYRPGPALLSSARSILKQTWADLELLVVDDASPAEFGPVLEECAGLDPRVRVIRLPANGGTYVARNAGLDEARGDYVTGQDDDDWSHPRRIEWQIAPLLGDASLRGTRTQCFRVSPHVGFTRPGQEPRSAAGSSLMFGRTEALATAGYFDRVRKAADTEYLMRLTHGRPDSVLDLDAPLSFVRVGASTLSAGEFTVGWLAEARRDYRLHYGHWHRHLAAGEPARLPRKPATRPFPAPAAFCRGIPDAPAPPDRYDVVILGEWQSRGGPSPALLDEARALVAGGLRVGVAHAEPVAPAPEAPRDSLPDLLDLAAAGALDLVQLDSGLSAELLLVRCTAALPFLPTVPTDLDVGRAVIVADEPPHDPAAGLRYLVPVCVQAIRDRFGVTPTWAPVDLRVRAALAPHVDGDRLEPSDLGWAVDPSRAVLPRPARRNLRPVLGWNPDPTGAWPEQRADLLAAYPADDEFDVRIRGNTDAVAKVAGRVPPRWVVFTRDEIAAAPFLRGLDFYVHAAPTLTAQTARSVLDAVALGCLAVLPPELEPTFGPVAEYATPDQVRATVRRWAADPVALAARVGEAKVALLDRFGPPVYVAAVRALLAPARA